MELVLRVRNRELRVAGEDLLVRGYAHESSELELLDALWAAFEKALWVLSVEALRDS